MIIFFFIFTSHITIKSDSVIISERSPPNPLYSPKQIFRKSLECLNRLHEIFSACQTFSYFHKNIPRPKIEFFTCIVTKFDQLLTGYFRCRQYTIVQSITRQPFIITLCLYIIITLRPSPRFRSWIYDKREKLSCIHA